jgi:hypothetical protein
VDGWKKEGEGREDCDADDFGGGGDDGHRGLKEGGWVGVGSSLSLLTILIY